MKAAPKAALLLLPLLTLAACESDFVANPSRPRPTRAVQSPVESNSATSEVLGGGATAVPIMSVDLPNNKDEHAQVHTIGDVFGNGNPATRPANTANPAPAGDAQPTTPRTIDPILGQ
jgi:hypothetical protein